MIHTVKLVMSLFILVLVGCATQNSEEIPSKLPIKTVQTTKAKAIPNMLVISATAYRGITPGSKIEDHKAYTEKSTIKTAEGTFEVYKIKDYEKGFAGYFLPHPQQEQHVGDIVIDVAAAKTLQGIRVGDSFKKLHETIPGLAVHGSEIEGRTHALKERHAYRLDVANFSYEVNIASIPADAKIMEIRITK